MNYKAECIVKLKENKGEQTLGNAEFVIIRGHDRGQESLKMPGFRGIWG